MPLTELPTPPDVNLPAPRPEAIAAIDEILGRLTGDDPLLRERAERELLEAKLDWTPALARRVDRVVETTDRKALAGAMEATTRAARKGDSGSPDTLHALLSSTKPLSAAQKDLAQLLGIARMYSAIGTTEAARELVRLYARTGDTLRVDVQNRLEAMGDRSLGALIEARRHQAESVARWANRQLDVRGKAIAHEAARTTDPIALADILVALGRSGDLDAARLLLSFASSERSQIRLAARQGIVLLGESAAWPLRDAYLDTTGRKVPRDWTWKRTARELFTEYDRLRLEHVFSLFEAARAAEAKGDLAAMKKGYDEVLLVAPLFEARSQMAKGYLTYAESDDVSPEDALAALERAERIAEPGPEQERARGLRLLAAARRLERRGIVDETLLARAAQLGAPVGAGTAVESAAKSALGPPLVRYGVAFTVSALALGAAGWILLGAGRSRPRKGPAEPESDDAP